MLIIVKKNKCVGCTACVNNCPQKAITMVTGEDGFKYPVIDQNRCIDCGLCKKTCPVLNLEKNESLNKCFAGYTKDGKYMEGSSSGGLFPLMAEYILDNDGLVVGAAFDKDNKLNHILVDNKKDLYKLKGSKYLQSNLSDIFKKIKENIKNKKILFVGTPCQVAGLRSYLINDYGNLYCIDLVCHGVPSPKLFNKYVKELEEKNNDKLINYNFRDKNTGWDTYSNTAKFNNGKYSELGSNNDYMKLFLNDIALRKSCYSCNFKLGNKYSDITLGDFWGINRYYPEMYNKKGVSAIIINTKKGNELFNIIKDKLEYKECLLDEIKNGNPSLYSSSSCPKNRNEFFNEIDSKDIHYLANKYKKKRLFISRVKSVIKRVLKK